MLSDIIDADRLIGDLRVIQGCIEWEYPLEYSILIDRVVELIREVWDEEKIFGNA